MVANRSILSLAAGAALLAGTTAVQAQKAVTVYGGARAGSGFEQATSPSADADLRSSGAVSLAFDWPYDASRQLQLLLSLLQYQQLVYQYLVVAQTKLNEHHFQLLYPLYSPYFI